MIQNNTEIEQIKNECKDITENLDYINSELERSIMVRKDFLEELNEIETLADSLELRELIRLNLTLKLVINEMNRLIKKV